MIDQDYVESMEAWIESIELSIKESTLSIEYNERDILLRQQLIDVNKRQLWHDEVRYKKAKKYFEEYLSKNKE